MMLPSYVLEFVPGHIVVTPNVSVCSLSIEFAALLEFTLFSFDFGILSVSNRRIVCDSVLRIYR